MAAPTHTAGRFVGQSVPRKEDPRLLTGRGRYTDDVELPRMLHAHFVRSDIARAKIIRLDVSAARQLPGVVAVLTGEDLNPRVAVSMRERKGRQHHGLAHELSAFFGGVRHCGPSVFVLAGCVTLIGCRERKL